MGRIIVGMLAVALIAIIVLVYTDPAAADRRAADAAHRAYLQSLERERERERNELERRRLALQQELLPLTERLWLIGGTVLLTLSGVGGLLLLGRVVQTRSRRCWPDRRGLLPYDPADTALSAGAAAALANYHRAQALAAWRGGTPATLHYRHEVDAPPPVPALPDASSPDARPGLPGVTDLASLGFRPTMEAILLALGPGGSPITVPMRALWHVGLAGPTGAGKTNIARMILAQILTLNVQLVIADPKWTPYDAEADEDWRPIARRLRLAPARSAGEIGDLLGWLSEELERRLDQRHRGEKVGAPLFCYVDELTTITADVKGATEHLARLARLGRGVKLFLMGAAHNFLVKNGVGDTRDQIRTAYYLGGDQRTAEVLLDLPRREIDERQFRETGLALLRSAATTPAQLVRVPRASNAALCALLDPPDVAASRAASAAAGDVAADVAVDVGGSPRPDALDPRAEQVRRMLLNQASFNEILAAIWQVQGGGRPQQRAAAELRAVLAQIAERAERG